MHEIVRINTDTADRPTVMGRELHEALEIGTEYKKWFSRMCEYGFTEGEDFAKVTQKCPTSTTGQNITDHQLTLDMAKEICMIQRTDKGKQCRQYFLDIERQWNSPEAIMSRALRIADQKLLEATERVSALELKIEEDKPKVLFADAVATAQTSILIGDLAKLIKQNGVDIGQKRLFAWMRENGYLIKSGSSTNMPTQRSMDMKLFEVKERSISNPDGSVRVTKTTKVTGKGQTYFINLFLNDK